MPNVRETQEINFGKQLLEADIETIIMYLVFGIRSEGTINITDGTHPLAILYMAAKTVWKRQVNRNGVYSITSSNDPTEELLFRNLGRLIKMNLDGYSRLEKISVMKTELLRNYDATSSCTGTGKATLIQALTLLYFVVGSAKTDLFGSIKTTEYMAKDDAFAGMFAVFKYVGMFFGLHWICYFDKLRRQGEVATEGGIMKGQYTPLTALDVKTWDSILVELNNKGFAGTPTNMLGMDAAYLDEPLIKGLKCILVDGTAELAQRLLSPSQWEWRFERWIKVIPYFNIWMGNETAVGDNDGGYSTECINSVMENYPLSNGTNIEWVTIMNDFIDVMAEIQGHFFKEKAFATCKAWFKKVNVWDLPTISDGPGGIMLYQMTHLDSKVATRDHIYHKFLIDTQDKGHNSLMRRADSSDDKRFLMLGDTELRDYLLHVGLNVKDIYIDGAKITDVLANKPMISPMNAFAISLKRDEDRAYRMTKNLKTITKQADDANLKGKAVDLLLWNNASDFAYGDEDNADTNPRNYPICLIHGKNVFYAGRAADPLKKISHKAPDVNALDADYVIDEMLSTFFGSSKADIPVSAIEEKDKKRFDNPETSETEVSALPEEEEKKEIEVSAVKQDEAEVKKLNAQITKLQKQIKSDKEKEKKKEKKENESKKSGNDK